MESLAKYPEFYFGQRLRTSGRVILADVVVKEEQKDELLSLQTIDGEELVLLDARVLSNQLEAALEEAKAFNGRNPLAIFPGNGSAKPRQMMKQRTASLSVHAKRFWTPGQPPRVQVEEIVDRPIFLGISRLVVIDDVISSGLTLTELHRRNVSRFPNADWVAATWISQMPRQRCPSGVPGYSFVLAACLAEGPRGRAPINSLSTLLECREIAESYASRHFAKPEQLDVWLNSIRDNSG